MANESPSDPRGEVSAATESAEEEEAHTPHTADRAPTEQEARDAEKNALDPSVAQQYEQANKTGADVKGEGAIE